MRTDQSAYYYLSKYRSELMGVAILWVVWFHSAFTFGGLQIPFVGDAFGMLKRLGYGGVDIFLLVSGMGICHSLQKHSVSVYFKNRLKKILPVWWVYVIVLVVVQTFVFHELYLKTEVMELATFTDFWIDLVRHGNWYVDAVMVLYLISPVLVRLIEDSGNRARTCVGMILIALAISTSAFGKTQLIFFARVPVYLIGMTVTMIGKEHNMNAIKWILCLLAAGTGFGILLFFVNYKADYLESYGLWWYPFMLIAPTVSLLICKVFDKLFGVTKPLRFVLRKAGGASLEILLATGYLFVALPKAGFRMGSERLTNFTCMVIGILCGFVFHAVIEEAKKLCGRLYRRTVEKAAKHADDPEK